MFEVQDKITLKLWDLLRMVRAKNPNLSFPDPFLYFTLQGTKGGTADPSKWEININLELAKKNLDFYLNQVIAHEFAHLLNYRVYKGKGHDRTWKLIMRSVFNLTPDRCHEMDTSEVKLKKYDTYLYNCGCGYPHKIKTNKHKKIQMGQKKLACAMCRKVLVFDKYIGKT